MGAACIVGLIIGAKYGSTAGVAALVVTYLLACLWFPRVDCSCCGGKGKHRSAKGKGKTWRPCWMCSAKGHYRRPGAVLLAKFARRSAE